MPAIIRTDTMGAATIRKRVGGANGFKHMARIVPKSTRVAQATIGIRLLVTSDATTLDGVRAMVGPDAEVVIMCGKKFVVQNLPPEQQIEALIQQT